MAQKFKYQKYLDKYKNCPKDCKEIERTAFRWVSNPPTESNFIPVLINSTRIIDDNDKMCTGYALSLYVDAISAKTKYLYHYNKLDRERKREKYKIEKGTCSAQIVIKKSDGVADEATDYGHFNFFEYENANLYVTISEIFDNFT